MSCFFLTPLELRQARCDLLLDVLFLVLEFLKRQSLRRDPHVDVPLDDFQLVYELRKRVVRRVHTRPRVLCWRLGVRLSFICGLGDDLSGGLLRCCRCTNVALG